MDELEWLKEHSPSTRPSRDVTRRHRTQLRAAIATEGADGTHPRRPRRERRSRHRVLVTSSVVVALCALGAGVVALTSSGGDDTTTVGAPATDRASATTASPTACAGAPPKQLAIPAGFGSPVAAPAKDATTAPVGTQQVTSWSSGATTIEQRWPADADATARYGSPATGEGSISSKADQQVQVDAKGNFHRTIVFSFAAQPSGCSDLQVTVYGTDSGSVDKAATAIIDAPFAPTEPLVTTTGAAATAPTVEACDGAASGDTKIVPVAATIGGQVSTTTAFAQPTEALTNFLGGARTLPQRGYQELHLDDSSIAYAAPGPKGGVVTTIHVVPYAGGWTVRDWQASGC